MKDIFGNKIESPTEKTDRVIGKFRGLKLYKNFLTQEDKEDLLDKLDDYNFKIKSHTFKKIPKELDIILDKLEIKYKRLCVIKIDRDHGYRSFLEPIIYEDTILIVLGGYQVWNLGQENLFIEDNSLAIIDPVVNKDHLKIIQDSYYDFDGRPIKKAESSWLLIFRKFRE